MGGVMRGIGLGLIGLAIGLSLAGCASTASEKPGFYGEMVNLHTLSCSELNAGMYNAYALVVINEEAAKIARKKILDDPSMDENKRRLAVKALDLLEEARKQKVIDPAVASYRGVEKEYKARCKDAQPQLAQLKREHQSRYIR
jgi:hypothetical protein